MLSSWSNFFLLTGTAGGTLVGLLFVVVALGNGLSTSRRLEIAHASLTPALYSFAGVLLQSMLALVPWPSNPSGGIAFLAVGIAGLIYRIRAVRKRNQLHLRAIQSRLDRIIHNVTPLFASILMGFGGATLIAGDAAAPLIIAIATTILLVSGIYRTWGQTLALIELSESSAKQ